MADKVAEDSKVKMNTFDGFVSRLRLFKLPLIFFVPLSVVFHLVCKNPGYAQFIQPENIFKLIVMNSTNTNSTAVQWSTMYKNALL